MIQSVNSGDVCYMGKGFTIGAVTRVFMRVWMWIGNASSDETIIEMWTDAGGGSERVLAIPFDAVPKGGTEVCMQCVVAALKVPINGTYECRIRVRSEANVLDSMYFDDIRVVES